MYDIATKTSPVAACWMRLWMWRSVRSCLVPAEEALCCRIYLAVKICSKMMRHAESAKRPMRSQPLDSPFGAETVADPSLGGWLVVMVEGPVKMSRSESKQRAESK